MIYDDRNIYCTIKNSLSDFSPIDSVFTSQLALILKKNFFNVMNFCMELSKTEFIARVSFT